jgi:hypothetical protein
MLFALSVISVPVQAHFTLGVYKPTYDYHDSDFDGAEGAHLPGLTGYVFPGAGPAVAAAPGFLTVGGGQGAVSYPGYQSLYPGGNPPGAPIGWYQADSNSYAPFGAILTSTIKAGTPFNSLYLNGNPTIWGPRDDPNDALAIEHAVEGDLVFAINYTIGPAGGQNAWDIAPAGAPAGFTGYAFNRFEIFVPPEFQNIKKENIVASFTNAYGNLWPSFGIDVEADIVSGFTRVRVSTDSALAGLTTGRVVVFGNSTFGDVWVYIRINKVTAPTIAGKYFFKMGARRCVPNVAGGWNNAEFYWLGTAAPPYWWGDSDGVPNFPVLLVKGEVDPAYVDGVVRYGGYSGALYYGQPLRLAGRVRLVGRAIDPVTLQTTNRPVEARGYFNASAGGHFEVEGVAPGVYDIYASAAGYPEKLIQSGVTILKGQSYHVDAYLTPGIVIQGEAFSKCGTGEVNWVTWQHNPNDGITTQPIKIEIYKVGSVPQATGACSITAEDVEGTSCTAATNAVSWSPVTYSWRLDATAVNKIGTGTTEYVVGQPNMANLPTQDIGGNWGPTIVGFPWPGYGGRFGYGFDANGVGPAQAWQVQNNRANFKFQFGDKGLYGTPAMYDAHVPQLNATWVDGIPAGQYEVRAFTYGYVQTKADGITFEHVVFNVPAVEWPGDIYVPFDLRLSNYVKKTIHFHDVAGTLAEKHIPGSATKDARYLYLDVLSTDGATWGWKVDKVLVKPGAGAAYYTVDSNGLTTSYTIFSRGIRAQGPAYWVSGAGRNYGFVAGTYTLKAYMYGYVEQVFEMVTIGLCGSEVAISDHLYRGVMFNVTFYSKDWEHPTADKPWKYPDEYIYLQVWKDGKQLMGEGLNLLNGDEWAKPDGTSWTSDGTSQPYVPVNNVVKSTMRIKAGHMSTVGWPTDNTTWAWLYYEGQEADYTNDAKPGYYPTSFESGMYSFVGLTYGYVMQMDPVTGTAKPFQVYASKGGVANVPIKLVVGVQIPLIIRFKHERVFEHLRYNSTVRVRVFDDKDMLVGEWLTSSSVNGTGKATDGEFKGPFLDGSIIKGLPVNAINPPAALNDPKVKEILGPGYAFYNDKASVVGAAPAGYLEAVNYVPRSTEMLNLTICGLPDPWSTGCGAKKNVDGGYDYKFNVSPYKSSPGPYGAPGAPYGISGQPWYTGGYYVEVEVVPFGTGVNNNHFATVSSPHNPGVGYDIFDAWYSRSSTNPGPVAGLLYGESCTIDPRTGKLYTWALPQNHLGPYQQRVHIALPGAHLGGESSGILELDHLGLVSGIAYGYTWCDDWRTTSWIQVLFSGAPGMLNYYTFDGRYQAYLPAGVWKMDVIPWLAGPKSPGYASQSMNVNVSEGTFSALNVYLEESGVPVPEFPTAIVVLASALAAALSILRRRRK